MDPFVAELIKLAPAVAVLLRGIIRLEARIGAKDSLVNDIFRDHCIEPTEDNQPGNPAG